MNDFDPDAVRALAIEGKSHLRKRARAVRKALPNASVVAASRKIVDTVAALLEARSATRVALFWPIIERNEVDLRELDARLRAARTRVFYPAIDAETRAMTFRDGEDLEERGFGFREPPPSAAVASALDVIIVPGLMFDATGHRIGYGAGYYDRTIPRFVPPALTVGVCFHFQLGAEVPALEHDVRVHMVVTDETTLDCRTPTPEADGA